MDKRFGDYYHKALFLAEAQRLSYNFDFTRTDVKLFLEGTANFDALDSVWTQNVVFRVVVVPADNVSGFNNPEMTDFNLSNITTALLTPKPYILLQ